MSVEDKKLARELLRELNRRRNIDVCETKVSVARCVGYISGVIRAAPGEYLTRNRRPSRSWMRAVAFPACAMWSSKPAGSSGRNGSEQ